MALARHEALGDTTSGHLSGHRNGQFVVSGQRDDLEPNGKALVQPQGDCSGGEFHGIPGSGGTMTLKEVAGLWLEMVGSCFFSVHDLVSDLQILNSVASAIENWSFQIS